MHKTPQVFVCGVLCSVPKERLSGTFTLNLVLSIRWENQVPSNWQEHFPSACIVASFEACSKHLDSTEFYAIVQIPIAESMHAESLPMTRNVIGLSNTHATCKELPSGDV